MPAIGLRSSWAAFETNSRSAISRRSSSVRSRTTAAPRSRPAAPAPRSRRRGRRSSGRRAPPTRARRRGEARARSALDRPARPASISGSAAGFENRTSPSAPTTITASSSASKIADRRSRSDESAPNVSRRATRIVSNAAPELGDLVAGRRRPRAARRAVPRDPRGAVGEALHPRGDRGGDQESDQERDAQSRPRPPSAGRRAAPSSAWRSPAGARARARSARRGARRGTPGRDERRRRARERVDRPRAPRARLTARPAPGYRAQGHAPARPRGVSSVPSLSNTQAA